jgi:hypothetical protein
MTTDYDYSALILLVQHLLILVGWLLGLVSLFAYTTVSLLERSSLKKYRKAYLKYERSCLVVGLKPLSFNLAFHSLEERERKGEVEYLLDQTLLNEEKVKAQRLKLATYHLGRAAGLNHNDPRKVALFTSCIEAVVLLNQKYTRGTK